MSQTDYIYNAYYASIIYFFYFFYFSVPSSPGGTAFDRECIPPDWILDSWHPLEKAQYPKYFAKREERKKEYIAMWEKRWGKPFIPHDEH